MKKTILTMAVMGSMMICLPHNSQAQIKDSLGLPGDNCNLYAVLNIFQQCKTLEEFEKKLNSADTKVNNLDLNGDHKIDYIKVVDNMQGTTHAIVLKDEVNQNETQDVAVIEVDKDNAGQIKIQIVGDEELYGKNYIVEPNASNTTASSASSAGTANPAYNPNAAQTQTTTSSDGKTTIINNTTNNYYGNDNPPANNTVVVHDAPYEAVPVVVYPVNSWYMWEWLFAPTYVVYVSPYRWGYYPVFWNPWEPLYYHEYYSYNYTYYDDRYYSRAYTYSVPAANTYYGQRRAVATTVTQRRSSGGYNGTYSRRDLLTRPAATGVRTNQSRNQEKRAPEEHQRGNNNLNQRNESKSMNENNRQRETSPQNNGRNESQQNNNQQRNNAEQHQNSNQQRNNEPQHQNNNQQRGNENMNRGNNNNNRPTPAAKPREEHKAAPAPRQESKPAPKPQGKEEERKR